MFSTSIYSFIRFFISSSLEVGRMLSIALLFTSVVSSISSVCSLSIRTSFFLFVIASPERSEGRSNPLYSMFYIFYKTNFLIFQNYACLRSKIISKKKFLLPVKICTSRNRMICYQAYCHCKAGYNSM